MKTTTSALMPVLAAFALTAGCSNRQDDAVLAQAAATETAYVNGRIYTQDEDRPWAESLVTKGDRIVFVGSDEEALEHAAEDARVVDLQNRFVMPGIIDSHTHPGLIATAANLSVLDESYTADEDADRMPSRPKEATLAWLRRYAEDNPDALMIQQGVWDIAAYLPHGPHKRDLDEISSLKPIMLNDNSGHSLWVNSAFLRLLGIDADTPDLSPNLSHFARDENGEPTGWIKEFALLPYFGDRFVPDADVLKERLLKYLNYMSSRGITTLWDAGTFNMNDAVYQAALDISRDGGLPLRWEGSHHIWAPYQIDTAVETLLRLREKYAHGRLEFNSIKIHYDGMTDILTAAMLEPYATDPDNYGGVLFTTERLSEFMRELDGHGIDLHMHASGDRATRNILDALEQAQDALRRPLGIEVTISHLFSVDPSDIARFEEMGVHANFTPHWFGGNAYGKRQADQRGAGACRADSARRTVHAAGDQCDPVQRFRVQPAAGEPLPRGRVEHDQTGDGQGRCAPHAATGRQDFAGAGAGGLYGERCRAVRAARTDRRHQSGVRWRTSSSFRRTRSKWTWRESTRSRRAPRSWEASCAVVACDGFTTRGAPPQENRTQNPALTRRPSAACVTHRRDVSVPANRTIPAMDAAASQPTTLQWSELAQSSLRATSQFAQSRPHLYWRGDAALAPPVCSSTSGDSGRISRARTFRYPKGA